MSAEYQQTGVKGSLVLSFLYVGLVLNICPGNISHCLPGGHSPLLLSKQKRRKDPSSSTPRGRGWSLAEQSAHLQSGATGKQDIFQGNNISSTHGPSTRIFSRSEQQPIHSLQLRACLYVETEWNNYSRISNPLARIFWKLIQINWKKALRVSTQELSQNSYCILNSYPILVQNNFPMWTVDLA